MRPKKKIQAIRYKTINTCLAVHFQCKVKELDSLEGYWEWRDADGTEHIKKIQDSLKEIRKRKVWGWVENKEVIHYFARKSAGVRDLINMFAHELGHMQRPWHTTPKEEQKVNIYKEIACGAYDLALEVKDG